MTPRIALVGHCGPDTSYLMLAAKKAVPEAVIDRITDEKALQEFIDSGGGLLLVNRVLDGHFADDSGIELIGRVTADSHVRAMLVSNYEDAQFAAVQAGALSGFGKRDIGSPKVLELIKGAFATA